MLKKRRRSPLLLCVALGVSSATIAAHDLWIEPTSFTPEAGKVVGVKLRVGQDLMGDPVPRDPSLIDEFIVAGPDGRMPIAGRDLGDPAGLLRIATPGLHVVGYRSKPSPIVMPAAKFNQYLEEEGLDSVIAARAARGQTNADAHEQFARCAKSLILTGPALDNQADRVLGFTLELIAEKNPYSLQPENELPVKILYQNRPLSNALIVAINRSNADVRVTARSDKDGRVGLRLPKPGFWLVKAVHMVPAAPGSGAEWLSYWASLTFNNQMSHAGS